MVYRTGHTQQTDHIEFLHFQLWVSPPLPHLYRVSLLLPLFYRVPHFSLFCAGFPHFSLFYTGFPQFSLFCTGFPQFSLFCTGFPHIFRSFWCLNSKQGYLISPPHYISPSIKVSRFLHGSLYTERILSLFSFFVQGFLTSC